MQYSVITASGGCSTERVNIWFVPGSHSYQPGRTSHLSVSPVAEEKLHPVLHLP